jgi:lipid-A-disaccharide synthase
MVLAVGRRLLRLVIPVVPGLRHVMLRVRGLLGPDVAFYVVDGGSQVALAACDVVLVASGTATLEAALFKRPMVVVYAMHALSWQMSKRMKYQPWVALPNILLRDFAVPELLQGDATPERIATAALAWLDDPAAGAALARRFRSLHEELRCDTARIATDAIAELLAR